MNGRTSWVPVKGLTKSPCHPDWMFGVTNFYGTRDALTGAKIHSFDAVLWNRTLRLTVSAESYKAAQRGEIEGGREGCLKMGLPPDVMV